MNVVALLVVLVLSACLQATAPPPDAGSIVGEGEGEGEGKDEGEGDVLDGSVGPGETCFDDRECNAGLTCDGGTAMCVPPAARHQVCSAPDVQHACEAGLECIEVIGANVQCSVRCPASECLGDETCIDGVCRRN